MGDVKQQLVRPTGLPVERQRMIYGCGSSELLLKLLNDCIYVRQLDARLAAVVCTLMPLQCIPPCRLAS